MNFGFARFLYASTNETAWNMFGFFCGGRATWKFARIFMEIVYLNDVNDLKPWFP
jgi:hypothetical protein